MADRNRPLFGYPEEGGPAYVETVTVRHPDSDLDVQIDVFADDDEEEFVFVIDEYVRVGVEYDTVAGPGVGQRKRVFTERAAYAAEDLQFAESISVSGVRVDVYADHFHDQFLFLVNGQVGACQAFDGIKGDHDRVIAFLQAAIEAINATAD